MNPTYTQRPDTPCPPEEATLVGCNVTMSPDNKLEFVKAITKVIDPEEVEYVADVKAVLKDCEDSNCSDEECADILYVTKIMAFADKFRVLHWSAGNHSSHVVIDKFCDAIESYKDEVAENIQAIHNQFSANDKLFAEIHLPIGEDPTYIIDQLKETVIEWISSKDNDMRYEGCRNTTSEFLQEIFKTIYLLRLCK